MGSHRFGRERLGSVYARGVQRIGDPRVWGTIVGAAGATVFLLSNRSELSPPWPTVIIVGWVLGLLGYIWSVFGARRYFPPRSPVQRRSALVYLASVLGMIALIQLGRLALAAADHAALDPALIVMAVGLHFLPFARAFHAQVFARLGWLLTTLGAAGLLLGWWYPSGAAIAALAAGLALLITIGLDAVLTRPGPPG